MTPKPPSHLFTLRLWPEDDENGQQIWRGKIYSVSTEDTRYFRDWPALIPLLLAMLQEMENEGSDDEL